MWASVGKALLQGGKLLGKGVVKAGKTAYKASKAIDAAEDAVKMSAAGQKVADIADDALGKTKDFAKKVMLKEHSDPSMLDPFERTFQKVTGLAEEAEDGIKFKQLTGAGLVAVGVAEAGVTTAKALNGMPAENSRGLVSVAQGMDRFVSYDGSGFTRNVSQVAGGDTTVMNDIVSHAFPYQKGSLSFGDQNLGDIVFALHNAREG